MDKKTVAIIFGGRSSEHEVSCASAMTIVEHMDDERYNKVLVGITKEGSWLLVSTVEQIRDGSWYESKISAVVSPDTSDHGLLLIEDGNLCNIYVDVAFPVLHGLYGEDGTLQGIFESANIPYVGCGVLSSAVSMDKFFTKVIVDALHIRQAKFVGVYRNELNDMDAVIARAEEKLVYPIFVKPSNAGSSVGVSKAHNRVELVEAIHKAAKHDNKILLEETINGREIECAVFGSNTIVASNPGEVVAAAEFYDYDAKYNNTESKTVLRPVLPEGAKEQIKESAIRIFRAVDGFGLARIDFFVDRGTGEIVFNELNTMPGFTAISMYPMLMKESGKELPVLIQELIEMAEER